MRKRGGGGKPTEAVRITRRDVLLLLTLGLLVHFLLPQIGEARTALRDLLHANPFAVLGSLFAAAATFLFGALALRFAAVNQIPLRPAIAVQVAAAFANLAPGSIAGFALIVRYLQKRRLPVGAAATIVAVARLAGFVSALLLLPVLVPLAQRPGPRLPTETTGVPILLVVVATLLLVAVALAAPKLRTRSRMILRHVAESLHSLVKGGQLGRLLSVSLALTVAYGACLYLALLAVGLPADLFLLPGVLLVAIVGQGVASIVPTPGGLGATEAAMVSGLLIYGITTETAVAGVLIYRLATFWLPLVPGFIALRALTKRQDI